MARPGFTTSRKFRRLVAMLAIPQAHALGHIEMLWSVAYEAADDMIGDATDLELAAGWVGDPGRLCTALLECGGDGAGLIEKSQDGQYRIHDFWDHAPAYVQRRAEREAGRREKGKTIADLRRDAARSRWGKSGHDHASDMQTDANGFHLHANGCKYGSLPAPSSLHPEKASSLRSDACAELEKAPASAPPDPRCPVFPTVGKGGNTWQATERQIGEWAAAFPALDVPGELRRAHAWVSANPRRAKTARGMPAFLVGWLNRSQDHGSGRAAKRPDPELQLGRRREEYRTPPEAYEQAAREAREREARHRAAGDMGAAEYDARQARALECAAEMGRGEPHSPPLASDGSG